MLSKKILALPVFGVLCGLFGLSDAYSAQPHYNCNAQLIPKTFWDMNRDKNQFLYSNNANHQRHYGWACGHKQIDGCKTAVLLLMPANHYWKDDVVTDIQFYSCNTDGVGSAWEPVGQTGGGYITQCTDSQMKNWKNYVQYGMNYYFCKKRVDNTCVDESRTGNAAKANDICVANAEQFKCWNGSGTWDGHKCTCSGTDQEWDYNNSRCVKSRKAETQDCYDRGGYPDAAGACRCADGEAYDTEKKKCLPKNECKSNCGNIVVMVGASSNATNTNNNTSNSSSSSDNNSTNVNQNQNQNNNQNVNNNGGGGNSSLQQCLNDPKRQGNQELLACCYLSSSGANGAKPNFTTGKCVCNDTNKTFSVDASGRGQCKGGYIGPIPPNPPVHCPNNMYYNGNEGRCMCNAEYQDSEKERNNICECAIAGAQNNANGECECKDPNKVIKGGACVYATDCPANMQRDANGVCKCTIPDTYEDGNVCKCNKKGQEIINGKCSYGESYVSNLRANISAKYSSLSSSMGGFKKSVWKDEDGNFNTARLASDSIAGVVLGTAGGIITSKLVKKNQLKKGFEDINCVIGGQNVASYGDSFSVGM